LQIKHGYDRLKAMTETKKWLAKPRLAWTVIFTR